MSHKPSTSPDVFGHYRVEGAETKSIEGRLPEGFNWLDFDSDLDCDDAK